MFQSSDESDTEDIIIPATGTPVTPKPSTSQENEYMPETPLAIPLSGTPLIPLQKSTLSKRKLTMPVSGTASAKKSTAQPPKNFKVRGQKKRKSEQIQEMMSVFFEKEREMALEFGEQEKKRMKLEDEKEAKLREEEIARENERERRQQNFLNQQFSFLAQMQNQMVQNIASMFQSQSPTYAAPSQSFAAPSQLPSLPTSPSNSTNVPINQEKDNSTSSVFNSAHHTLHDLYQ